MTSSCVAGEEGCACLDGGICESGLLCASKMCIPGGDMTDGSSTGESSTTTGGTTTTTSVGTTGGECSPADGSVNSYCAGQDAAAPYCSESGSCVDCSGLGACVGAASVCDPEGGLCVECVPGDSAACIGTTPVCDDATKSCVACTSHEGCPSSACNMLTGECFADDAVLWVDAGDKACSSAGGSESEPFCTLTDAMVEVVESGGGGPAVVRIHKGIYDGSVSIPGGKLVAIVSADLGAKVTITGKGSSVIGVPAGATLIADGLDIASNSVGAGIEVTNGQLWLDRLSIHGNKGLGVITEMATNARIRRTLVTNNAGGGIKIGGGVLRVENSYVTQNGTTASFDGGITASGGGEIELIYSSVIGNQAILGDPSSLVCVDAGPVIVRNSVIVAQDNDSIDCDATIDYSAIDVFLMDGSTNMMLMSDSLGSYFIEQGGIYQAKPNTQLGSVARWEPGDPAGDFDGDSRPSVEGPDFAGADVP